MDILASPSLVFVSSLFNVIITHFNYHKAISQQPLPHDGIPFSYLALAHNQGISISPVQTLGIGFK